MLGQDPQRVLAEVRPLLSANPDARLFRVAAAACRAVGDEANAVAGELAAIKASLSDPLHGKVAEALAEGDAHEARRLADDLLVANEDDLLARLLSAEADLALEQPDRAAESLVAILDRAPTFLRASLLLVNAYKLLSQYADGIALLDQILTRRPSDPLVLRRAIDFYGEASRYSSAADLSRRLLEADRRNPVDWILYAHQLRIIGDKSGSEQALREALKIDPNRGSAWWGLANFHGDHVSDEDRSAMETALIARDGNEVDGGALHIALGVLDERSASHASAFDHFAKGKALRSLIHPHDGERLSRQVDEDIAALEAGSATRFTPSRPTGPIPLFMVGIPRSGSTLVERILDGHSRIEAAGELLVLPRLVSRLRNARQSTESLLTSLSASDLDQARDWYLDRATFFHGSDAAYFTDKLNANWQNIALIRLLFPEAKIIDVRRNALDCCWSNFRMLFAEGHTAGNDLRDLGRFYRDYVRLMGAIDRSDTGAVLTVRYEEVVADAEAQARRITDFLDLEFEPAMLDFHQSTAPVATPSSEQVRRPINREGIGGSAPFRPWLGPLIEELGPLADD